MQVRKALNGQTLFGLVNNAGLAVHGPLMYQPIEDFRTNIDVNIVGTLQVTQAMTQPASCLQPAQKDTVL